MKRFIIIILFFVLCAISGCTLCSTKKVTCLAFDEPAFSKWFPYELGSRHIFKNSSSLDTVSYTIEHVNNSGTYEITTGGFSSSPPQNCTSSAYLSSVNYNHGPWGVLSVTYSINNDLKIKSLAISFNNGSWETGEVFDSSIATCNACNAGPATVINKHTSFVSGNGNTYNDVIELTSDTGINKLERAYKVFIAKNIGIIGCEMFPSKQKWVIQ